MISSDIVQLTRRERLRQHLRAGLPIPQRRRPAVLRRQDQALEEAHPRVQTPPRHTGMALRQRQVLWSHTLGFNHSVRTMCLPKLLLGLTSR